MDENFTVVRFSRDASLAKIENLKYCQRRNKVNELANFSVFYVICIAFSIITYALDLILTLLLLYFYYNSINFYETYFLLTLIFTLVPAIMMTTISLRWYIIDHDDPSLGHTSVCHWIFRIIILLFQLAPLLRYVETLTYGIKSKIFGSTGNSTEQMIMYRRMLDEDTNSALLRLFHCFLHAAPQTVIQLIILVRNPSSLKLIPHDIEALQVCSVLTFLISIAWSLTSYQRSVRNSWEGKKKLKYGATIISFLWHLMSTLSRVLALSLLASIFPAWMIFICLGHWGMMWVWLSLAQTHTNPCHGRCGEFLLSAALGFAYIIAFISPKEGQTRYLYLAYYLVCFMENTGVLVVWCVSKNSADDILLYYGAVGMQLLTFLLGIIFLLIYYRYCHPSKTAVIQKRLSYSSDKPGFSKDYHSRSRS